MAKRGKVEIERERCKGCLLCIRACPVKVLEADTEPNASGYYPAKPLILNGEPAASAQSCIACGNCYEVCPDVCIRIFELEGAQA
jgi:2-oxoglutarate ferredoxin oxidoreductase subunit delta